jgi:Protein of unknown function (DUF2490)
MTTTMTIRRIFLTILFFFTATAAFCQDDFGLWFNISAEHKLVKRLQLDLTTSLRTFDNSGKIDEAFLEAGLNYKINKYLSIEGAYRISDNREKDDSYHARHKWFFDIKGNTSLGDLSLTARFRFEESYKTYYLDDNDNIPRSHGRYKLKALYNIPHFPINPFIASEIFCPMFTKSSYKTRGIDKARYMGGVEYNFTKRNSLDIVYLFQRDYLPHISDINIISLEYNLKF